MNFDEQVRKVAQNESDRVPQAFRDRVDQSLVTLPRHPGKSGLIFRMAVSVAAALALVVTLPNVNASMAAVMGNLPVVGPLFQAVTFRTYQVEEGKNHVSISVPQVVVEGDSEGAEEINREVTEYTDKLIAQYEEELHADGYFNLDVSWEVVKDTENWFTLKLNTDQVLASGNHQEQYYHIDVATGELRTLSDLFPEDYDYVEVISRELKEQMQARMEADAREVYWLEGETQLGNFYFDTIDPEHNFYFNEEGKLVIPFNKYEVGPGSTGSPKFVLETPELYDHLLYRP